MSVGAEPRLAQPANRAAISLIAALSIACTADAWFAVRFSRLANSTGDTDQQIYSGFALFFGGPVAVAVALALVAAFAWYRLRTWSVASGFIGAALVLALLPLFVGGAVELMFGH